jgi:DNA-binding transcriptional LysR family regulator
LADSGRTNSGGGDLTAMELMQLEMFVAVVEEGSVHRAAHRVCRTQPAVSIALKKLAIEVGAPLFNREHRFDYKLTPTGEVLYSYATRLLGLRNEAVAALRDLTSLRRGAATSRAPAQVRALLNLKNAALGVSLPQK